MPPLHRPYPGLSLLILLFSSIIFSWFAHALPATKHTPPPTPQLPALPSLTPSTLPELATGVNIPLSSWPSLSESPLAPRDLVRKPISKSLPEVAKIPSECSVYDMKFCSDLQNCIERLFLQRCERYSFFDLWNKFCRNEKRGAWLKRYNGMNGCE
jgi:hypothetical protein